MGIALTEGKRRLINIYYERRVKEQLQKLEASQIGCSVSGSSEALNETMQSISCGSVAGKRRGRGDRKRI